LAPHEPLYAFQIAKAFDMLKRPERAGEWARRALQIDVDLRLDPLRQFSERDRDELTAIAARAESAGEGSSAP
jgi:hypothetical protein